MAPETERYSLGSGKCLNTGVQIANLFNESGLIYVRI